MNMNTPDQLPFLDLKALHESIKPDLLAVLESAIETGTFVGGPALENFEKQFAAFCGTAYCIGVSSGTDALRFALMAAIPPGSIVITVPNTFIATTEAISQAGAFPVFVDIDAHTYNLDPQALAEFLDRECSWSGHTGDRPVHRASGKTVAAIVPVHLYGQTADMDPIQTLADKYNILILEDACQAHGSRYFSSKRNMWRIAGSMSTAAAFSFYPGKNLGALGEAGAVTTDDPEIASMVRLLREHGSVKKYVHPIEGYNGRMDAIQAGFLSVKLPLLMEGNYIRRQCAGYYSDRLAGLPWLITPFEPEWVIGNFHLYIIQAERRDELQLYLSEHGIATGRHYPVPLHLQEAYRHLGYGENAFPITEAASRCALSLPMFPSLSLAQQDRVIEAIYSFYRSPGAPVEEALNLVEHVS